MSMWGIISQVLQESPAKKIPKTYQWLPAAL